MQDMQACRHILFYLLWLGISKLSYTAGLVHLALLYRHLHLKLILRLQNLVRFVRK